MCHRRVAPLMVQIPPFGGGQVTVRSGKAPKLQTTSAKNIENGGVAAEVVCVLGTTVPGMLVARETLNMRVNPLIHT